MYKRQLLSQEVIIHGKERLYGVIGAKPPHLQEKGETEKAVPMDEMMIDVGLHPDDIKKKVTIGDLITFKSPLISLGGNMVCGKSIDLSLIHICPGINIVLRAIYFAVITLSCKAYRKVVYYT